MNKICITCKEEKPLSEYHKSAGSKDGYKSKCKTCAKTCMAEYNSLAHVKEKRKIQQNTAESKAKRAEYVRSPEGKASRASFQASEKGAAVREKYMNKFPGRHAARTAVRRAVEKGTITKLPCWECGETEGVEGHHADYDAPLDVVWLCVNHHNILHYGHEINKLVD